VTGDGAFALSQITNDAEKISGANPRAHMITKHQWKRGDAPLVLRETVEHFTTL
jgi:hypothetical protein